jgi:hypothetical protein
LLMRDQSAVDGEAPCAGDFRPYSLDAAGPKMGEFPPWQEFCP